MAIKVAGAKPKKRKKKGLLRRAGKAIKKLAGRARRGKAGKKAGTSGGG
jgi:hypothetical protein